MTIEPGATGIAIIGMACRFPGAETPTEFWENLRSGTESITFFSDEELIGAGIDPALVRNQNYIKASPILKNVDMFDAAFFGYSPKEAAIMDPQHRLFLETCWEAFEDAGYSPNTHENVVIGIYAGAGSALTSYLLAHSGHPAMQGQTAGLQHINNDKDFLSTRVSYKLNLTGPSITVQTACSTSLVAVHLACQSLLGGECDVAVAGASTVRVPHISGYLAERGSVHSADGHCRAFDASGVGTIFGSGVAAVLLKPVASALEHRDHIYAVIKGSAVNNDGAGKISYTATSATGQARAIVEALEAAQVRADTLGYVECHATGTPAGDPVEIQALTRAFRLHTRRKAFCAVGSVKTNIGHPEQTAGLAGLIKTALALKHGEIPPTIHFATPNPGIPFTDSPFYVQSTLRDWPRGMTPRRAAVNSLGIGGTNAFAVLEEAPEIAPALSPDGARRVSSYERSAHLFCISAKTGTALRAQGERCLRYLESDQDAALEDICHTANASRSGHQYRFAVVCSTKEDLKAKLAQLGSGRHSCEVSAGPSQSPTVAFLFSGQGTQYVGMSAELYRTMPRFREVLDQCDAVLRLRLKTSLLEVLFAADDRGARLRETRFAQPALFAVQYALAELWQSWGVVPGAVMGHSVGEFAAACAAGVLEFRDAIEFVAARGELMQALPECGVMEAIFTDEERVRRALESVEGHVSIAALNSPHNTVVSGDRESVARLRQRLEAEGIGSKSLAVSHAFHSALVEPIFPALKDAAAGLTSRTPKVTLISNVTGEPLRTAPAASYWLDHARQPVRFSDGMRALRKLGYTVFVEIGPGATSIALGRECVPETNAIWLASINKQKGELRTILESLGKLYMQGHKVDWERLSDGMAPRRVPVPTYPFERKRFWLDPPLSKSMSSLPDPTSHEGARIPPLGSMTPRDLDVSNDVAQAGCLYRLAWDEQPRAGTDMTLQQESGAWLVFGDKGGLGTALVEALERRGDACHLVRPSSDFVSPSAKQWTLDSANRANFDALLDEVFRRERHRFRAVVFLWGLDVPSMRDMTLDGLRRAETIGTRSALYLVQALAAARGRDDCRLWVVTRGAQSVPSSANACAPTQALLWGLGRTVALEAPNVWGGAIDLPPEGPSIDEDAESLVQTIVQSNGEQQIALRGRRRYLARLESLVEAGPTHAQPTHVRGDCTYLITGGFGMLGLTIAKWLVEQKGARFLALVSRTGPSDHARSDLARLEAQGARVRVISADVSKEADVRQFLELIQQELPPLKGVIHCAGALADGIVTQMNWDSFARATAPKVLGSWLLHQYTQDLDLDFFLLQSSLLSLTGSVAQANYTAANAFLDALVDYRCSRGLRATAINWGPWGEAGMAASTGGRGEAIWKARGMSFIRPAFGMQVLDHLFARSIDHAAVARCDWNRYLESLGRPSAFYSRLAAAASEDSHSSNRSRTSDLRTRLADAYPGAQRGVLLEALREEVMGELNLTGGIDTRQPLQQLGLDSLMSVNLVNRLEIGLGVRIPLAKLVRGPSLEDLTDELLPELAPSAAKPALPTGEPTGPTSHGPRSVTRGHGWLVFPKPNDNAPMRLFCFNFAGGGAGSFRAWAAALAPSIELVAIEPPGRGSRLHESPLAKLDPLLDGLMPEMRPYLDRPCAFFGHCLGGLTLFEAARRLLRQGFPDLVHLFVSGARPPHRVTTSGLFEEDMLAKLLTDHDFDPLRPFHEQPDNTFANVLRQFNIWATDDFLAQPDLRALLLPAIRADFEIASTYRFVLEAPWDIPITCFNGLDDRYVMREHAMEWNRHTKREFRIHLRKGNHFLIVEDRDFIVATINAELAATGRRLARHT